MPVGFPATESGVEIRILKHLFTPEEAEIALNLSALPEPLDRIYRRVKGKGLSIEKFEQILDGLVEKGAIMGGKPLSKRRKGKYYSKAQLAIGMFEFQVDRITRELAQDFFQYMDEGFAEALHSKKTSQMRTIPIDRSLTPEHHVGQYDDARQLIMNSSGPFAVINCICRQSKDLLDEPCKLSDIRETCLKRCQMDAISVVDGIANVDLNRCIGCGLCVTTCETNAIQLKEKERLTVPPRDHDSLYKKIMMERFGPWGMFKVMANMSLGRKI